MKKRILILLLLLSLLLCACSAGAVPETVYTVEQDGKIFTVDTKNRTITHEGTVYGYCISETGSDTTYTITYPDSASYHMTWSEYMGYGGGDELYYQSDRLDADIIINILRDRLEQMQARSWEIGPDNLLYGLALIIIGIIDLVWPHSTWYHEHGWLYKNAEPSEIALNVIQACGILAIIGGIVLIIVGIL